jgi:hypothetical protein
VTINTIKPENKLSCISGLKNEDSVLIKKLAQLYGLVDPLTVTQTSKVAGDLHQEMIITGAQSIVRISND